MMFIPLDVKGLDKQQILEKILIEKFDCVIDTKQNKGFFHKKLKRFRIPYFYVPQFKHIQNESLQYEGKEVKEIMNNLYPRKIAVLIYFENENL